MIRPDQDVIDGRGTTPAAVQRKQTRKDRQLRAALEAFDKQQLLHEYGLTPGDLDDD